METREEARLCTRLPLLDVLEKQSDIALFSREAAQIIPSLTTKEK